jgi:hypothetical protein
MTKEPDGEGASLEIGGHGIDLLYETIGSGLAAALTSLARNGPIVIVD